MDSQKPKSVEVEELKTAVDRILKYNQTVIAIGYSVGFGILFYLRRDVWTWMLPVILLALVMSACIFAAFEVIANIYLVKCLNKLWRGTPIDGSLWFTVRYWHLFFYPSLAFAVLAATMLVIQVICMFFN